MDKIESATSKFSEQFDTLFEKELKVNSNVTANEGKEFDKLCKELLADSIESECLVFDQMYEEMLLANCDDENSHNQGKSENEKNGKTMVEISEASQASRTSTISTSQSQSNPNDEDVFEDSQEEASEPVTVDGIESEEAESNEKEMT